MARRRKTKRRRKAKSNKIAKEDITGKKLDDAVVLLKNIYWNGFEERRGTSYRISRSRLRDFAELQRLETGTMKKLMDRARKDDFILYPLDKSDYASANDWIFERLENLKKLPLADEAVIGRAGERSDAVSV